MKRCLALIVAAGVGERFGASMPKQYLDLEGQPVLRRSVLAFLNHPEIHDVRVVINPSHRDLYDRAVEGLDLSPPIAGGTSRQESVRLGLQALAANPPDYVMIHDGARPLVSAVTIGAVRKALESAPGAIAARAVTDTLKLGADGAIKATVERAQLWHAYTPQAFHFGEIITAHENAKHTQVTDDAAVAELAGIKVTLVPSSAENLKITNPEDLERARRMLTSGIPDIRTGMGYDVHRLIPGEAITLCGVVIPHTHRLDGHSDADVGLHALVDAILGAMAAGDIGTHFPPSDEQWRGKDSAHFVKHVVQMVKNRGGVITNVDVTLICEAPRVGPYRQAMVARMAELLEISADRVSIKATTSERLGFTGREEGIAAQALATLRFPSA